MERAFRDCFAKLGSLRTCFPDMKMLALTATADKNMEKKIVRSLAMSSFALIRMSPNRLNIRLSLVRCTKLTTSVLDWVVQGIKTKGRNYEKTIIYCQSIENVSKVYLFLKEELGFYAYGESLKQDNNSLLIGILHRNTLEKYKQRVINDLSDVAGYCRVVVATSSLEMGIDFCDIRCVIHYGSPRDTTEYIQGIGRAGRDKQQAQAILYFSKQQLSRASQDMKKFVQTKDACVRFALFEKFENNNDFKYPDLKHYCYSYCHLSCTCQEDGLCSEIKPKYEQACLTNVPEITVRDVTKEEEELFFEVLQEYNSSLEQAHRGYATFTSRELLIGLSTNIIQDVLVKISYIISIEYVMNNTAVYKREHAGEIILMLQEIFGDIKEEKVENAKLYIKMAKVEDLNLPLVECCAGLDMIVGLEDNDLDTYFDDMASIAFSDNEELSS